jgi:hypothetical protein
MVEFSYRELAADLKNFAANEGQFLAPAAPNLLIKAAQDLTAAAASPHVRVWEVQDTTYDRIETFVSKGECETGNNVQWTLKGTLSFMWEIQRVSPKGDRFRIINATTRLRLLVCDSNGVVDPDIVSELAVWRFEIGDVNHPGARFHSQVDWPLHNDRRLEIPRLPSIVLTPLESLDFLLGELFQKRWPEHQSGKVWQSNQRGRLLKLLEAATNVVTVGVEGSALMQLKAWKPAVQLTG